MPETPFFDRTDIGTLDFARKGMDDRATQTSGVGTRHFLYVGDGRMLAEYGASATDVKAEFIWLSPDAANDNSPFGGGDGAGG
ncbi:MAG: hypothetical protein J7498_12695 [Sphingobium sp.]|nr:hypothetical protein [Sphingobium sp.]